MKIPRRLFMAMIGATPLLVHLRSSGASTLIAEGETRIVTSKKENVVTIDKPFSARPKAVKYELLPVEDQYSDSANVMIKAL